MDFTEPLKVGNALPRENFARAPCARLVLNAALARMILVESIGD